jgi:hypothetical protein
MKMQTTFIVRNLFKLPNGTTVLACDGKIQPLYMRERMATLSYGNSFRQSICITGKMHLRNQAQPRTLQAFETNDTVRISTADAQSGIWKLTFDEDDG